MTTVDNVNILCFKIIDTRPHSVCRTASPSTRSKNVRVAARCYGRDRGLKGKLKRVSTLIVNIGGGEDFFVFSKGFPLYH
jgi:hypothetical protein